MRKESSEQPILKFAQVSFIPKDLSIVKAHKIFEGVLYKVHNWRPSPQPQRQTKTGQQAEIFLFSAPFRAQTLRPYDSWDGWVPMRWLCRASCSARRVSGFSRSWFRMVAMRSRR